MMLIDIEVVIEWLAENIDNYELGMSGEDEWVRTFFDLKTDLRKLAEGQGEK